MLNFKGIYAVLSRIWKCRKSRVFGANFLGQKIGWCSFYTFLQLCSFPPQNNWILPSPPRPLSVLSGLQKLQVLSIGLLPLSYRQPPAPQPLQKIFSLRQRQRQRKRQRQDHVCLSATSHNHRRGFPSTLKIPISFTCLKINLKHTLLFAPKIE